MPISPETIDFTQEIAGRGWVRMPQQQHIGRQIESTRQPETNAAESPAGRGQMHLALGGIVRMRPRKA